MEEKTIKKLSKSINYKVLGIIFALTIVYQISLYLVDPDEFNVPEILYLAGILACAGFSFMVFKRYRGSEVFEAFDNTHPTNTLWVASFMVVMYTLYKHRQVVLPIIRSTTRLKTNYCK